MEMRSLSHDDSNSTSAACSKSAMHDWRLHINLNNQLEFAQNEKRTHESMGTHWYELFLRPLYNIENAIFKDVPDFYPFRKKVVIFRNHSNSFVAFDFCIFVLSCISCINYVISTYDTSYEMEQYYTAIDYIILTAFLTEALINRIAFEGSIFMFLQLKSTMVNLIILAPMLAYHFGSNCVQIMLPFQVFRLFSIFKILKPMKFLAQYYGVGVIKIHLFSLVRIYIRCPYHMTNLS
jgi:hypothetical protein